MANGPNLYERTGPKRKACFGNTLSGCLGILGWAGPVAPPPWPSRPPPALGFGCVVGWLGPSRHPLGPASGAPLFFLEEGQSPGSLPLYKESPQEERQTIHLQEKEEHHE